ncbi:hypothetical protein ACFO0N_03265 [Halobium salinum]|uniref:Uncharacterized protein n=1 Tax=Halobium salinum TaxID=1364940 RepID=A0ABD5P8C0_9EURY|nr:hypothetical protein [Halobium salinum]
MSGERREEREEAGEVDDGPGAAPTVETVVLVVGVAVTLLLFGYVGAHALATPDGANPTASVVSTDASADGVRTTVALSNPGDIGLSSVTVDVDCGETTRQLQFRHVPADGTRQGTVACPAGSDPSVSVSSWIAV